MDAFLFTASALLYRYVLTSAANTPSSSTLRGSSTTTTTATAPATLSSPLTWTLLLQQNAATSNAVMELLSNDSNFIRLSEYEGKLTLQRDTEDDEKLQKGIDFAKEKGVIDPNYVPEPYKSIDVYNKTPEQVAREILKHVEESKSKSSSSNNSADCGSVIVLVGLSGTGKGTTVSQLRKILEEEQKHQVVTWSNGNIFRSVTLLATTWCQQQDDIKEVLNEKALTKENLASFMNMITFGKFGKNSDSNEDQYDIHINGFGLDLYVSQIANTLLKSPQVSQNIPTVAQYTQGEVITFAAKAVQVLCQDGLFVLLEGRAQTVDYVRSPHRFALTLSDSSLIGKRRAAQRIMATALNNAKESMSEQDIMQQVRNALAEMVKEI